MNKLTDAGILAEDKLFATLDPVSYTHLEGIIGGKTGYTSKAGNTLVTGAQRNGVRLIAVVMKASGSHYTDTIACLLYTSRYLGGIMGKD